jgi:hypothetical protein
VRAFRLSRLLTRRSLLVIASLLGADVAAGQRHPEAAPQTIQAKPARTAIEAPEAHHEVTRAEALPTPQPRSREAEILARAEAFDVEAHIPPFWIGPHFSRRPLEPARRRRRLPERCHTTGGYREHCSGPRLTVTPSGTPAALAARIGLGRDVTAMQLLGGRAFAPWLEAARGLDPDRHLTYPVPEGHNGRGFGYTRGDAMAHVRHDGIDIGAPSGSTIVAARGGLVAYTDNGLSGMGNLLIILHSDGDTTTYAHCERILVQPGQVVDRGEHVADVGHTGFAFASHLHFEWRQNGWIRDPQRVLLRREGR